jgi:hypothetical protein
MTRAEPLPRARNAARNDPAETVVLLAWVAIQSISLLLSVGRIGVAGAGRGPVESGAAAQLIVVQFAVVALGAPIFLRTSARAVLIAFLAIPYSMAAGFFSAISPDRWMAAYFVLLLWIMVLTLAHRAVRSAGATMALVAAAGLWTLGWPVLGYLSAEFGSASVRWMDDSPAGLAIATLNGQSSQLLAYTAFGSAFFVILVVRFLRSPRRARRAN